MASRPKRKSTGQSGKGKKTADDTDSAAATATATATATDAPAAPQKEYPISLADVKEAAKRIKGFALETPVLTSSTFDALAGKSLFFKCENFQKVGAFKIRGALNAAKQVPQGTKAVVTHSSGNHAQALALAARECGIEAHIVMPHNVPGCKRAAVEGYGGKITFCEPNQAAREKAADDLLKSVPDSVMIPPFDHKHVMAGQGTIALELLKQVKNLDAIIVEVGGGGMISGIAIAAKTLNPKIKIYGAEPQSADDCAKSFRAKKRMPLETPTNTIADGLRTGCVGAMPFEIIVDFVDDIFTVTEEEIIAATKLVWERMKLVIEPSAGVGVAVAIGKEFKEKTEGKNIERVAVVLCGGNQDLDSLPWIKK